MMLIGPESNSCLSNNDGICVNCIWRYGDMELMLASAFYKSEVMRNQCLQLLIVYPLYHVV